jgi:hypothetical protein
MKNGNKDAAYVVLTTEFRFSLPRFVSLSLVPAEWDSAFQKSAGWFICS